MCIITAEKVQIHLVTLFCDNDFLDIEQDMLKVLIQSPNKKKIQYEITIIMKRRHVNR